MIRHKKLVSILIMAAMLLTLLPTAGFAEELSGPQSTTQLTGGNNDGNSSADNNSGSNSSTDSSSSSNSSTDSNSSSDSSADSNSGSNSSTDNNSGSNSSTDNNNDSNSSADNNNGSNSSTDNNSGSNGLPGNNNGSNGLPGDNNGSNGLPGDNNGLTANMSSAKNAASPLNQNTRELTIYHILTTDGAAPSGLDSENFTKSDNYIFHYKVEHLSYKAGYVFNIEQLTASDKYWQAPQSNWKLTGHTKLDTMPADYSANIKLYYQFQPTETDFVYSDDSSLGSSIRIEGLIAFCLNKDLINPSAYKQIPYKLQPDFSTSGIDSDTQALLRNILLVGYPCDALGLQKKYANLPPAVLEDATQQAVWAALDKTPSLATEPYAKEVYATALALQKEELTITFDALKLADGLEQIVFTEQEDGTFTTAPFTLQGYYDGYTGPVSLASLPASISVYTVDGENLVPVKSLEAIAIDKPLVFQSAVKPTLQEFTAAYAYRTPTLYFYEAYLTGYISNDTTHVANGKGFQNLLAFDTTTHNVSTTFPITVTETTQPPATTPQPTPTPTPDPEVPGDGGGDYTPDTPSTPNTTPTETIIPDEAAPLAPAPEVTLIQETVEPEEVIIADDPVPQAPAAPVSDNPKTGHHFNFIWLVQMTLLLSALALLLNDVLKYQHAKQK